MDADKTLKKLYFERAARRLVIDAPVEYLKLLAGQDYDTAPNGEYDFIQVFATAQADLEAILSGIAKYSHCDGYFWICYPKGTGNIPSDIKRDTVWQAFQMISMRPVTQVAIDDNWSALRGRPGDMVGK